MTAVNFINASWWLIILLWLAHTTDRPWPTCIAFIAWIAAAAVLAVVNG